MAESTYEQITREELELFAAKNQDYAGTKPGGETSEWGNFDRVSTILGLYPDLDLSDRRVVAITYAMKQVDAVLHQLSRGFETEVEGLDAKLADVHIYFKIVRAMNREMTDGSRDTR